MLFIYGCRSPCRVTQPHVYKYLPHKNPSFQGKTLKFSVLGILFFPRLLFLQENMDIQFLDVKLCFCLQFPVIPKSLPGYFHFISICMILKNQKIFHICPSTKINVFVYQYVHTVNDELWISDEVFIWKMRDGFALLFWFNRQGLKYGCFASELCDLLSCCCS